MALRADRFLPDAAAFVVFTAALGITLLVLMGPENPPALLAAVAGTITVATGVELLVAAVISRLFGAATRRMAFALLAGVNGYSLYLVHLNQSLAFEAVYAVGLAVVFGLMLRATAGNGLARGAGAAVMAVLPALSLWSAVPEAPPADGTDARLAAFRAVELRETPNIYLISFDALMPGAAAQQVLDIDSLPYEDWLRNAGAVMPKNSFVTYTPSIPSLDAVMKLDDNAGFQQEGYFAGRLASPLSELLHANGYSIETGSSVPYYFGASGDHVDRHTYIAKNFILDNSLCKFAGTRARVFGVFGFCTLDRFFATEALLDEEAVIADPDAVYFDSHWHDLVLERIAAPSDRPRLIFYYYFYPIGHAPNDFVSFDPAQMADYRKRFGIQAVKAEEVLAELYRTVQARDPGAILLFFGDHGPKTSRTADWREHTNYWVIDNHAVLFALMPMQTACAQPDLGTYNGAYHTAGRMVASVLRCLARDPAQLDRAVAFLDKFPFDEYLYE
jgi:hypothetical protein